jgi:hypothetical protein
MWTHCGTVFAGAELAFSPLLAVADSNVIGLWNFKGGNVDSGWCDND